PVCQDLSLKNARNPSSLPPFHRVHPLFASSSHFEYPCPPYTLVSQLGPSGSGLDWSSRW
ncbi:hypothetical protein A2U01_0049560, partial [Trifolium medium]|nr:hypothetical protein [Trifolium medium]